MSVHDRAQLFVGIEQQSQPHGTYAQAQQRGRERRGYRGEEADSAECVGIEVRSEVGEREVGVGVQIDRRVREESAEVGVSERLVRRLIVEVFPRVRRASF